MPWPRECDEPLLKFSLEHRRECETTSAPLPAPAWRMRPKSSLLSSLTVRLPRCPCHLLYCSTAHSAHLVPLRAAGIASRPVVSPSNHNNHPSPDHLLYPLCVAPIRSRWLIPRTFAFRRHPAGHNDLLSPAHLLYPLCVPTVRRGLRPNRIPKCCRVLSAGTAETYRETKWQLWASLRDFPGSSPEFSRSRFPVRFPIVVVTHPL
jgi:hypothetical protein